MKKHILVLFVLLVAMLLSGCTSNATGEASTDTGEESAITEQSDVSEETVPALEDWGITLTAINVTPTGLTIVCEQADGAQQGRLQTGTNYWVEIYDGNTWQAVPYLPDEYSISWTAEALIISLDDTTEWSVDWQLLYGELPSGTYRIGKSVSDFVEGLISEKQTYYATFEIT